MTQKIGLNMYTLRDLCTDAAGLNKTFAAVHDIGYRYVQISGLGAIDPPDIVAALGENRLQACATHLGWDQFVSDTDTIVQLHRDYGTTHAAIGGLPEEYRSTDGAQRFIEEAKTVLPHLKKAGLDFSYHNHNHEFVHYDGRTWLDIVHDGGASVGIKFEIDTYWVVAGGADPAEYLSRFSDAMSIIHAKDMIVTPTREQRFAPVGSGNLNWPRIFDAVRSAPVEFVIVEQDAHYDNDPLDNVAQSFTFLKQSGFSPE